MVNRPRLMFVLGGALFIWITSELGGGERPEGP